MKRFKILLLVMIGLLLITGSALAMISPSYSLFWYHPTTGSGGVVSSANMLMDYTVGQTASGQSSSAHYKVSLGYWSGVVVKSYIHVPLLYNEPVP